MSIRWTEEDLRRYEMSKKTPVRPPETVNTPLKPIRTGRQPNKAETEYGMRLQVEFPGADIRYEALTFKMLNGHKYTPDWVVTKSNEILCVEVKVRGKDGFRHPSYQRARVAFDQCRVEFPMIQFRWAEKSKGVWNE